VLDRPVLWPACGDYRQSSEATAASIRAAITRQRLVSTQIGAAGYALSCSNQWDEATWHVLGAFQMKYRPSRFDGISDAETAALLDVLTSTASANP
jgi:N-acetylmuramoyl-L-alanine amidase